MAHGGHPRRHAYRHPAARSGGRSLGYRRRGAGDAVRLQRRPVDVPGTGADEAVTLPEVLIVAAIVVVAFLAYLDAGPDRG